MAALVVAAGCRGDETTSSGPSVALQKQTARGCYATLTPAPPAKELGLTDLCPATDKAPPPVLVAGIDQVRAVIDYAGVEFPGSASAPAPTVTVTIDGKASTTLASVQAERRTDGRTYFLATFVVPNVVSNNIRIDVTVNAGYDTPVATVLSTVQPVATAATSVLTREPNATCVTRLYGPAPDSELKLDPTCATPVPEVPKVAAAVQRVQVVIDEGAIDFPAASQIPVPTINVLVDGVDSSTPVTMSSPFRVSGHIYFLATFHPPALLSDDMRLVITATPGAGVLVDKPFQIIAPAIAVGLVECPTGSGCEQAGAVGNVHTSVTIIGDVPQMVAFHNLIDGVPVADSVSPAMTAAASGTTTVTVPVPVPVAAEGSSWVIDVQIGATHAQAPHVTIRRPPLVATLSCQAPCTVAPNTSIGLFVSAPKDIAVRTATLNTAINGIPVLSGSSLPLGSVDNDTGLVSGSTTLPAPPTTGTWSIDVSVDGYHLVPLLVTVQ
jgi:hypothetical protein